MEPGFCGLQSSRKGDPQDLCLEEDQDGAGDRGLPTDFHQGDQHPAGAASQEHRQCHRGDSLATNCVIVFHHCQVVIYIQYVDVYISVGPVLDSMHLDPPMENALYAA